MLILFQKKTLCILVEHYYKYNLFSLKLKITRTDTEPESESESEEEISESTVLDE